MTGWKNWVSLLRGPLRTLRVEKEPVQLRAREFQQQVQTREGESGVVGLVRSPG